MNARRYLVLGLIFPALLGAADDAFFSPRVQQWGLQEITLRSQRLYRNPFVDVGVEGRFRSQNREIAVDGFYDGAQTPKIRFMPETSGPWTSPPIPI